MRLVLQAARIAGLQAQAAGHRPVIVMLSGGRDSVCLLDVCATVCGPSRVRALHVNYGLRAGADADQDHCAATCASLGVPLEVLRARRPREHSGNLQAWARDVRYAQAKRLALDLEALVAVGHTASDQVETVLYRLAASPGRRALLGMVAREGLVLRPLLGVTRGETTAYCQARGLGWRDDPSNDTERYARGRVRGGLVAALREVHPAAEANVLRTVVLLRDEAAVLDEVLSDALEGRDHVALARLARLPPALARLIVVRLAEDAGGCLLPGVGTRVAELVALGHGGGSAALDVGGGVRAIVEYGILRMSADPEDPVPLPVALPVPGRVRFGAWRLHCETEHVRAQPGGEHLRPQPGRDPPRERCDCDGPAASTTLLDADALGSRPSVRGWRAGDRVSVAGLRGSKTLADLFAERRVPRASRPTIPIVEVDGAIAWVAGLAADPRFGVSTSTRRIARLQARRMVVEQGSG